MPKPTVRVLLHPHSSTDELASPRTVRILRRTSAGPSYYAEYSYSSSPPLPITIRQRPSDKEDKRWEDPRPSSPRQSIPSPTSTAPPLPPESIWHGSGRSQRPSSALATSRPHARQAAAAAPPPPAPPSSAASSSGSSSHSRRSSQASNSSSAYLYGQDYAYGAEPLRLRRASTPVTIHGAAGSEAGSSSAAARRRVRFASTYP